ncbi:protein of unknown function [Candidatus Filomicrobium marinum]|uniref:Uncharacterized protein n=1 Tax=Candidatus Filomicrobium marinum TaxID=1608628 RepID=A0A0D6JCD9_9HYPH|nr:protein of unknown function [Candidatus Filomicrobium marinum]CPR16801.1 protein of unknown function [Candidatus Filomicrobium marinum]
MTTTSSSHLAAVGAIHKAGLGRIGTSPGIVLHQKLQSAYNDIAVPSFILSGAPLPGSVAKKISPPTRRRAVLGPNVQDNALLRFCV